MNLSEFDYVLPPDRIAQHPPPDRGAARMLVLERTGEGRSDSLFRALPELLRGNELLVVNNTRVLPARLFGRRTGIFAERHGRGRREFLQAPIEILLTRRVGPEEWEALVRPGRKMRRGERVLIGEGELEAEVLSRGAYGARRLRLSVPDGVKESVSDAIERLGHVPLPPYISRPDEPQDRERYQTIFAREAGAVAAPTAGLHFTPTIVEQLRRRGMDICEITLDVGLGTFQPIHTERIEDHTMHSEGYQITPFAWLQIQRARAAGRPLLAVGTTVVRALEDAVSKGAFDQRENAPSEPFRKEANLFIYPGYEFRVVDQLLTNFHLPRSSLLIMVAAFAGRQRILRAYRHAIEQGYRFYSYGDCMLIR